MNAILGVIFHITGGVAAGSFYMPYKRVTGWKWENFWIVGGIFAWFFTPFILTAITLPGFFEIIFEAPLQVLAYVFIFGVLWGIGGLTFGLGIRYLGMSLGNSLILGLTLVFGAVMPLIYYSFFPQQGRTTLTQMFCSESGKFVLIGILLSCLGIYLCGRAGILKERQMKGLEFNSEFNLKKGLLVAIISGILSACFSYGIEAGKPLAEKAVGLGNNPLFQNNVTFVVLLWGGLLTNLIWCFLLNLKNRSFGQYYSTKLPLAKNYILCFIAGTTWFLQFFFYGMGESKLGSGTSSWILHMTSIILVGNLWGIVLKEWKGTNTKTRLTISIGILMLLISISLVGFGND